MANIQRNRKIGGTNTFESEFQLGFDDIRAMEIDADFDTLYDAWNAGLNIVDNSVTSAMLVDGAVTTDKLAADSVDSSKIINGSITELDLNSILQDRLPPQWSPGEHDRVLTIDPTGAYLIWAAAPPSVPGGPAGGDLAGSTYPDPVIAPLVITSGKLADLAVQTGKIANNAVTVGKLALGAAINSSLVFTNTGQSGTLFASQTNETNLVSRSITTRGGPILIFAEFTGFWTINTAQAFNSTWEWYIRRDTALTGTIIRNVSSKLLWPSISGGNTTYLPIRMASMILDTTHTAPGTYQYHMSYKMVNASSAATAEYYTGQTSMTLVELA